MLFTLNDDHRQIQELIRRVAREKIAARANDIDRTGEYPQDMFDLLKSLGLFTLPFPKEYGGTGSILSACVAAEELSRVCYNTCYVMIAQWGPFGAILHGGNETQKNKYLSGLATGELRASIGVTEPQSGSDVAGIRTRARRVAGGFKLNGSKIWCTNSPVADFVVVAAKLGDDNSRRAINLFIVEKDMPGYSVGPKEDKMGARGLPSCPVYFDDVFVPETNLLGEEGRGFKATWKAST